MINVALSHDVDRIKKTYQYFTQLVSAAKKLDGNKFNNQIKSFFSSEPYWCFDKMIEIEKKYSVKSTFFILNESIDFQFTNINSWKLSLGRYKINESKLVDKILWLDQNGWEIGVHGSYNSYKDYNLLSDEKKTLENILGHEVIGIRQHYLNLDQNTWNLHRDAGFKYDSSWGFTDGIGFKEEKEKPFAPFKDSFIVYPLHVMDYCFINESQRWEKFQEILEVVDKNNSLLVINWHQRVFNKSEFPQYSENYTKIIEKLKNLNANFYTIGEYYNKFYNLI